MSDAIVCGSCGQVVVERAPGADIPEVLHACPELGITMAIRVRSTGTGTNPAHGGLR